MVPVPGTRYLVPGINNKWKDFRGIKRLRPAAFEQSRQVAFPRQINYSLASPCIANTRVSFICSHYFSNLVISLLRICRSSLIMTRQRSVRIAEDRNITNLISTGSSFSREDSASTSSWASQDEFDETKQRIKRKIQEWKMKGYGVLLRDTFSNSHHSVVQRKLNAVSQLDERDCIRGSERRLCPQLDQKISTTKLRCVKTVLSHQRIINKKMKQGRNLMTSLEMQEELAVVSRMQSRPCVQYARRMGKADELAARYTDACHVVAARKMVEDLNILSERQKPKTTAGGFEVRGAAALRSANARGRFARMA